MLKISQKYFYTRHSTYYVSYDGLVYSLMQVYNSKNIRGNFPSYSHCRLRSFILHSIPIPMLEFYCHSHGIPIPVGNLIPMVISSVKDDTTSHG